MHSPIASVTALAPSIDVGRELATGSGSGDIAYSNKRRKRINSPTDVVAGDMSPEDENAASPRAGFIPSCDNSQRFLSSPPSGSKFVSSASATSASGIIDFSDHRMDSSLIRQMPMEGSSEEDEEDIQLKRTIQAQTEKMASESWPSVERDVETFDGKIVYNRDGSAYIIEDSELSEEDSQLPKLLGNGCIVDGRGVNVNCTEGFPQIANAIYVTRNPASGCQNSSYGSAANNQMAEAPVTHSYRVFTVRDKVNNAPFGFDSEQKIRHFSDKDCSSVPIKPILMCFVCKLSFGYAKSFVSHAVNDHGVTLRQDEKDILSRANSSAIIQCVGKDKEPLVSFLEPLLRSENATAIAADEQPSAMNYSQPRHERSPANILPQFAQNREIRASPNKAQNLTNDVLTRSTPANANSGVMDLTRKSPNASSSAAANCVSPSAINSCSMSSPVSLLTYTQSHALNQQTHPPNFLTGTTIGVCPDHTSGRPSGVDCSKCEMILSSSRLSAAGGGPLSGMHSRNSCKTLKCPKCNWHYKYQETLEIHMKEKHPEAETSCIYCIAGQPHPRLARGETYTCGYKPYRCEVCNYSTTTKGNLSIHMQSDKHLNNMQEIQNGGGAGAPGNGDISACSRGGKNSCAQSPGSASGSSGVPTYHHSPVSPKQKNNFVCSCCNYETNVARNLRIHMTSEKHNHNVAVINQGRNPAPWNLQAALQSAHHQSPIASFEQLLHFHPALNRQTDQPATHSEAALADMAYNQALLIQLITGGQLPPHVPTNADITAHMDLGLNPESMDPPPDPADPNPEYLYQCCVCNVFATDSVEALSHHTSMDRSKQRESETVALVSGHFYCKQCKYRTPLKANFQLHCKTDKHLIKLNHVNHVKEGGPANEWKIKHSAASAAVQLRCNCCDYYTNSVHKLQLHSTSQRHDFASLLFRHIRENYPRAPQTIQCLLCELSFADKLSLFQHIRSARHLQMEQLHQLQRRSTGQDGHLDINEIFKITIRPEDSDEIDKDKTSNRMSSDGKYQDESEAKPGDDKSTNETRQQGNRHSCSFCEFVASSELEMQAHILCTHFQNEDLAKTAMSSPKKTLETCPLCQDKFVGRGTLEKHVMQIHSVNAEGLQRLLMLVNQSHWLNNSKTAVTPPSQRFSPSSSSASSSGCKDVDAKLSHSDSSKQDVDEMDDTYNNTDSEKTNNLCPSCSKTFKSNDELRLHQLDAGHFEAQRVDDAIIYLCPMKNCGSYFSNAVNGRRHFLSAHPQQGGVAISEKHSYKYRCVQCSSAFRTIEKLQAHSQYHYIRDSTKCSLCGRNFRSIMALQKHVEQSHMDMSKEEVEIFKRSLMNNPLLMVSLSGEVLDPSLAELMKKETPTEEYTDDDTPNKETEDSGVHATNSEDEEDSFKENVEEYLNSATMAEEHYNDPERKFKCTKCKMAFTKQCFLTNHNRKVNHRKNEKMIYTMEKYLDPNRPFKCEVCKESFTQKNILLVHYNSVAHLHKEKQFKEKIYSPQDTTTDTTLTWSNSSGSSNSSGQISTPKSNSGEEDDRKPFKCNICKLAYAQVTTLDIHMRSVLHRSNVSKLQESTRYNDGKFVEFEAMKMLQRRKSVQDIFNIPAKQALFQSPPNEPPNSTTPPPSNDSPLANECVTPTNQLSCDKCNTGFTTREQLKTHQQLYCMFGGSPMDMYPSISSTPNITTPVSESDLSPKENRNNASTTPSPSPSIDDSSKQRKSTQMYKHLLESYGFDLVMQYNENLQRQQNGLSNNDESSQLEKSLDHLPELRKSTCSHCDKDFSSIWVLKAHYEEVHKVVVPWEILEKYAEQFKRQLEGKSQFDIKLPDVMKRIETLETQGRVSSVSPKNDKANADQNTSREGISFLSDSPDSKCEIPSSSEKSTCDSESTAVSYETPRDQANSTTIGNESAINNNTNVNPSTAPPMTISMAQQMNEQMQATLNAMAASQLQQHLQFNPMMMSMAMALPLGLNIPALAAMNLQPPLVPMMMSSNSYDPMVGIGQAQSQLFAQQQGAMDASSIIAKQHLLQQQQQAANSQQKRARTRITDEQLKILRAHFDINNSPSEEQIHKMASESGLPPKVIKHWFRNTLFKERQRNKDSPYNFNNPPSTTLNLEEYEKTGEAKVISLSSGVEETISSLSMNPKINPVVSETRDTSPVSHQIKVEAPNPVVPPPPYPVNQPFGQSAVTIKTEPKESPILSPADNGPKFHPIMGMENEVKREYDNMSYSRDYDTASPNMERFNASATPCSSPENMTYSRHGSSDACISNSVMHPPKANSGIGQFVQSPLQMPAAARSVSPARSNHSMDCFPHNLLSVTCANSNGSNSSSGSSGKRANRTRFTDYQIKVLQEFFENNAYPKDDDLEYLSKLLSLSPRVIVVWFQNARQKARKVYENQPTVEPVAEDNALSRTQKTPNLNYQCKKCMLVFQRYYELIRHQKSHCFKEEDAKRASQAQAAAAQVAAVLSSEDSNSSTIIEQNQPCDLSNISNPPTPSVALATTPSVQSYPIYPIPSHSPSTPESKEANLQCDHCSQTFPRFDLWREHQLIHIMNPTMFSTYPPDSAFGILQQHAQQLPSQTSPDRSSCFHSAFSTNDDISPSSSSPSHQFNSSKRKYEEYVYLSDKDGDQPKDKRLRTTILPEQLEFLYQKYKIESNPSRKMLETIANEVNLKKRVVQVWFQNTRARERKGQFRAHSQVINKRCPFCPALFKVKSALESHLVTKHAEQFSRNDINIDALPDEEMNSDYGESGSSSNFANNIFQGTNSGADDEQLKRYYEDSMRRYLSGQHGLPNGAHDEHLDSENSKSDNDIRPKTHREHRPLDLSKPVDLSCSNGPNLDAEDECSESECSEESEGTSWAASTSIADYNQYHQSDTSPPKGSMSKLQAYILRYLYNDYKTPSLAEFETLSKEVGLPRHIVQIWFQNARFKDKKLGEAEGTGQTDECKLCLVSYSPKYTMQHHIFSKKHIDSLKANLQSRLSKAALFGTATDSDMFLNELDDRANNNTNEVQQQQLWAQLQMLQMAGLALPNATQQMMTLASSKFDSKSDEDMMQQLYNAGGNQAFQSNYNQTISGGENGENAVQKSIEFHQRTNIKVEKDGSDWWNNVGGSTEENSHLHRENMSPYHHTPQSQQQPLYTMTTTQE